MTEQIGPGPAAPRTGDDDRPERPAGSSERAVDRRLQRRWGPLLSGPLSFAIEIGPGPAAPRTGDDDRPERPAGSSERAVDRRLQRRWVPLLSGLLSFAIGIIYIVEGISPGSQHRLHGVDYLGR